MQLRKSKPLYSRLSIPGVCLALYTVAVPNLARADVIVLTNRSGTNISARFQPVTGAVQQVTLPAGMTMPMFVDGPADLQFALPGAPKKYNLGANCAYYFGRAGNGGVDLQKIGLGEDETKMKGRKLPGNVNAPFRGCEGDGVVVGPQGRR